MYSPVTKTLLQRISGCAFAVGGAIFYAGQRFCPIDGNE
jgi:hypothetical protein